MQGNEIRATIMHRSMILIYISCLALSLAPAITAPPEREFARGQPELHQAMDNMVTYRNILSKRIGSDTEQDRGEKLTSKTANLLSETEHILSSFPVTKERQWLESFVERMRAIAIMLEKTAPQNKKQNLPEGLNSANLTRIPDVLSIQPTWPTISAVPETNSFQKSNRMTSKSPVTSPEFSDVLPSNEYSTERHSVTKPVVLLNESDEDELAKELNSLHQLFAQQNSKELDHIPVVTTSSSLVSPESHDKKVMNIEEERERIKSQLIKEIAEFRRLGGKISSDLINDLEKENQETAGFTKSPKQDTDIKFNSSEAQKNDELEAQKKNDLKVEGKKYSVKHFPNIHLGINKPHEAEKLLQQLNLSHSFHNNNHYFNPSIHAFPNEMEKKFPYKSPPEIPYEASLQNARHSLLKPKTYNNKVQYYQSTLHSANKQSGHIPEALKLMLSKPKNEVHDEYLTAHNYNEFLMKHGYGPYPYKHSQDHKILTHYPSSKMFSHHPKQPVNHQMDAELSEEMKRQLRDGKIIVLSDSVVRSNFEPCKDGLENDSKKEKLPSENIEKKNESKISK